MIIQCDAKALEWVCGSYLSKDKVAYQEIKDEVDQHTLNQQAFKLPSRLIAKKFVFRLMYGGSAYSYANDPDFTDVSTSTEFWQEVIDAFYNKYEGFSLWHASIVKEAIANKQLVMPTGRIYKYDMTERDWRGNLKVPETTIKNYPVQGLGADIMSIARVLFYHMFKAHNVNGYIVNTIHDSIVCDVHNNDIELVNKLFQETFKAIPNTFEKVFKLEFDLPLRCEVSYGNNMKELTEFK